MSVPKSVLQFLTSTYHLANKLKLLRRKPFRRAFVWSYFLYKRYYEDPFWHLVQHRSELFRSGHILDIGANIGYTSTLFSRALAPEYKIYSFEPDALNFYILQEVIAQRHLSDRVVPLQVAVGANDGVVELWRNEFHHGDHRVATKEFKERHSGAGTISIVPLISVDNFVESHRIDKISFIKIDVQGYELAVLEGMKDTLSKFPDITVAFEYTPGALRELGFLPDDALKFFTGRGYRTYVLQDRQIVSATPMNIDQFTRAGGYVDLLCAKRALV